MTRMARIGSGVGLVLTGTALLVLPGPGVLTIAAGLAVLSKDFPWAGDTLDWMKGRFRRYFTPGAAPASGEPDQEGG